MDIEQPKIHIGHTCTRRGVHLEVTERVGSVVLAKARSGGFDGWAVLRITPIGELSAWHRICADADNARRKFHQLIQDEALEGKL
jgi:hypothetical protein